MPRRLNTFLFWALLCLAGFSFFNRNSVRNINEIVPETINAPVLGSVDNNYPIQGINRGFRFNLTPVYKCEITGLIVDCITYGPVRINNKNGIDMNKNFTIMWGTNVSNKTYKNKAIQFFYGGVNWKGYPNINFDELARVALIAKDKNLWGIIKGISRGDQIKIIGKLVNGSADRITPVTYCSNHLQWDTGMPGKNDRFWTIYVEDIIILDKANPLFNYLFVVSILGLILVSAMRLFGPVSY